ncbi:MAG: hypothetical protein NW217_12635 [Hyphomicrobiaceae bacterium]|nr:hypothetical protein [Hyphomicrobiaceae bacterium]
MSVRILAALSLSVAVGGCSTASGVTTGSLFGVENKAAPAAVSNAPTPTDRALHVGTTAARAAKCGYNFDAAKLKANYFAAETAGGLPVADVAKLEQVYVTGFNGVSRAAADDPGYCNAQRTAMIKTDLTRALAGDFTPPQVAKQADGGLFGFLENDDAGKGPKTGSEEWWDKQREKVR